MKTGWQLHFTRASPITDGASPAPAPAPQRVMKGQLGQILEVWSNSGVWDQNADKLLPALPDEFCGGTKFKISGKQKTTFFRSLETKTIPISFFDQSINANNDFLKKNVQMNY